VETSIEQILEEALKALDDASDVESVKALSVRYLGRKGAVTLFLRSISQMPPEKRAAMGKRANDVKNTIDKALKDTLRRFETAQTDLEARIDVTLPGRPFPLGSLHPISRVTMEICDIFVRLGFDIVEGPEVESDWYNFEALNMPVGHPARGEWDTLFVDHVPPGGEPGTTVLRTHTSPVQIRTMLDSEPPIYIVAPGRVFRRDTPDSTHMPVFHQIEGLLVDEGVTFGHLKATLETFLHALFSDEVDVRLRPGYFPFTEPSAEVDISCIFCDKKGCGVCSGSGWIEILGAGMVDPRVFEAVGFDSDRYTGFAFGLGLDRVAMLVYGIPDLRQLFAGDQRLTRQFA